MARRTWSCSVDCAELVPSLLELVPGDDQSLQPAGIEEAHPGQVDDDVAVGVGEQALLELGCSRQIDLAENGDDNPVTIRADRVDLADTLVSDYDVVDLLTGLADRCVRVLGATAAGVMLASSSGDLRLVASSSETMRVLELFELQAKEGPCLDAFRAGERVEHENLRAGMGRWPRFSTVAVEAGFRSAFALPLRLRDTTIGALNLVSVEEIPMDEADVLVVRAFADLATISVLQQRATAESNVSTNSSATR